MSYILDALRRAEADRQRGQVPGLSAQPALAPADADAPARLPAWAWAVAAVAVIALGVAVLWLRPPAAPVAVVQAAPPTAAVPAMAPPMPAAAPPMPVVVSAAPAPVIDMPAPVAAVIAPPPPPMVVPPAAAPPRAEPAPTPLASLSADQRRELPPLVVGGSIWSDSVAQRFVIVNGQVVHEGEAAAPGVVLERITPKSAVVRWRDLRIELPL